MPSFANTWRGFRVGLALALFAGLSVSVTYLVVPIGGLFSRGPRDLRGQWANHLACRVLRYAVEWLGIIQVRIIGEERLRRPGPFLIVANHPTRVDMGPVLSARAQVDQIVNEQLASTPLLAGPVAVAEYLTNDGAAVFRQCVRRLRAGRCLLIFPEGTRSPEGGIGPMKRGAAQIALAAGVELQPITITCEPPVLTKGWSWRNVPDRIIELKLRVEDPIPVAPLLERGLSRREAARELTAELEEFFLKRITGGNA